MTGLPAKISAAQDIPQLITARGGPAAAGRDLHPAGQRVQQAAVRRTQENAAHQNAAQAGELGVTDQQDSAVPPGGEGTARPAEPGTDSQETAEQEAAGPGSGERPGLRLWAAGLSQGPAEALARLSVSVQFDWRLAPYDLLASAAHARVLHRAGLLDDRELTRMTGALSDLQRACRDGSFRPDASDEDVHTALERGLLERLGSLGGKLPGRPQPQRPDCHRPAPVPA